MNKDTRNAIERATQRARKLLEEDFAAQLEGDFDVHRDGEVSAKAGKHLSARQTFARERVVAAIEHKRAAGMSAADAARDYLRDAAFTTLNRFVALKMLEARELVQECITKGELSGGYREFCGMAPGLPLLPESAGYRLYLESLFDELSTEVKVLFDRRDPASVLWPKRATFEQLLELLNAADLAGVWGEDETVGWVYQFFNGQDERRRMRDESPAPRNSRELAVRNQFFTPRYVVQFLTDNTLGRIWYEMRGTRTALADKCEYMVRKPGEDFAPRAKKDPRDLRVLDPACGSGHFLLYAFDLLLAIYEEAHVDPESPKSEATGKSLAEDYPSLDALKKALPGLALAHNLHGVDIDARCAQIAQLALWMRAQKAYRDFGMGRAERAQIRRSNIVVAEPLVADDSLAKEFVAKLGDADLGRVFTSLVESLSLAGDLGLLLRVEQLVSGQTRRGQNGDLFAPPEERIRAVLDRFVCEEASATSTRRRLFADDAAHALAVLEVAQKPFDVVLMNPPFGECTPVSARRLSQLYPTWNKNLICAFTIRMLELLGDRSLLGSVVDRSVINKSSYAAFRREILLRDSRLSRVLDLGWEVLDANVEVSGYVLETSRHGANGDFVDIRTAPPDRKAEALRDALTRRRPTSFYTHPISSFGGLPHSAVIYDLPDRLLALFDDFENLQARGIPASTGFQLQAERHFRNFWEVPQIHPIAPDGAFCHLYNGGEYSRYALPPREVARIVGYGKLASEDFPSYSYRIQSKDKQFLKGVAFGVRGEFLDAHTVPDGVLFTVEGQVAPASDTSFALFVVGLLNSGIASRLLNSFSGQHKYSGYVNLLPCPPGDAPEVGAVVGSVSDAIQQKRKAFELEETCLFFTGEPFLAHPGGTIRGAAEKWFDILQQARTRVADLAESIDGSLATLFSLDHEAIADVVTYRKSFPDDNIWWEAFSAGTSHLDQFLRRSVSYWIGCAFGRWDVRFAAGARASVPSPEPFAPLPGRVRGLLLPAMKSDSPGGESPDAGKAILVMDDGHPDDLVAAVRRTIVAVWGTSADAIEAEACELLRVDAFRSYLEIPAGFAADHLSTYTHNRRRSPIYWQLATPSASYAVWLYIHAFSKDTLFRVQNDYVAPKLAHEERRLESITSELRDGATAAHRKQLAEQEGLVEELRAFLDELKRVAPLWKPNLDDGVIINFAPLWRLVPQNKAWQKELKSTWDALCDGKYDWAHLAMHLWPERVVPKCAKDRSLAIAHGLEDVFWVEGTDGKWTGRKTPTKSVDELVKERTSPAVKSALKSLLEAPVASGKSTGRKGGGRRKAAAAVEGGDV